MSKFKIVKTKMFSVQITPEDDGAVFPDIDAFYVRDMKEAAGVLANYPHEIERVCIDSVYVSNYEISQKATAVDTGADDAGC